MWIAELPVVFVKGDGTRIAGRIAIGIPYRAPGGEARCPVAIDGLYSRLNDIAGDCELQSLLLAIRFVGNLLSDFCDKGGKLFHPSGVSAEDGSLDPGHEIELSSFFGPLVR